AKAMPLPRASILFRPRRLGRDSPSLPITTGKLVEAPGTAPGSAALIPQGVYRHSRLPDHINIGLRPANRKGLEAPWSRRGQVGNLRFIIFDSPPPGASMPLSAEQQAEVDALADATQPTRRATVPALEEILYKAIPVLDHGFVRVIDYMGDDSAIVQAARVSYGKGTKKISEDKGLINYLLRHRHTTPFEMCEMKFHVKLPIFVARQWLRHRTANVNESSARYSILDREFYVPDRRYLDRHMIEKRIERQLEERGQHDLFGPPEPIPLAELAAQSKSNRQGRDQVLSDAEAEDVLEWIKEESTREYTIYQKLLNVDEQGRALDPGRHGLARELARMVLPANIY